VYDATKAPSERVTVRNLEILRPLRGLEETHRHFEGFKESDSDGIVNIHRLRTGLQVCALAGDWSGFERLAAEARVLAQTACAPALTWIADWGESVQIATAGRPEEAVEKAAAAADSLEAFGERYTAVRLLADLLPFLDGDSGHRLAEDTAGRLEAMGALTSAAAAREWASSN
jgi:hypothetical protein